MPPKSETCERNLQTHSEPHLNCTLSFTMWSTTRRTWPVVSSYRHLNARRFCRSMVLATSSAQCGGWGKETACRYSVRLSIRIPQELFIPRPVNTWDFQNTEMKARSWGSRHTGGLAT